MNPVKSLLPVLLLLAAVPALAAQNALYLDTLTVKAGGTAACRVHLRTDKAVRSVQFDLAPNPSSTDITLLRITPLAIISSWTLDSSLRHDTLRVILYKLSTETIPPGDTALINVEYTIAPKAYTRDISLLLSGASVVDEKVKAITDLAVYNGLLRIDGERPRPGDTDGSGKVDVFDLIGLLRILSGHQRDSHGFSDLDGNGKIDVFDLLKLLRIMSGRS